MNAPDPSTVPHVISGYERVSLPAIAFGLLAGPLAWYAECCAGYAVSSWACFPKDTRHFAPVAGVGWTWTAVVSICIVAFAIALTAFLVSWRIFQVTRKGQDVAPGRMTPVGLGRARFLAVWGMAAGAGFAIAVAFNAVALIVLPQCAG